MLFVASFLNCIVDVPDVAEAVVFEKVNAFPSVFKPFIVTLSEPLRLSSGAPALITPLIVQEPPDGLIVKDVQVPAAKVAPATGSVVLFVIVMTIFADGCVATIAEAAALSVA